MLKHKTTIPVRNLNLSLHTSHTLPSQLHGLMAAPLHSCTDLIPTVVVEQEHVPERKKD